jgi:hypothetical protein
MQSRRCEDDGDGIGYGRRLMSGQETKSKYKDTVILPDTPFPMRGDLAKREPEILARWEETALYERISAAHRCSSCTTGRRTRTATSTTATSSTRS